MAKVNQSLLQTGKPKGTFKVGDQNPINPKYVYHSWIKNKNLERWTTHELLNKKREQVKDWHAINGNERNRKSKLERDKKNQEREFPRLDQKKFQTNSPFKSIKKGSKHPDYENLIFYGYNYTNKTERWIRIEQWEIRIQKKATAAKKKREENKALFLEYETKQREKHREEIAKRNRERHERLKDTPEYKEQLRQQRIKHAPKKAVRNKKWKKDNHKRLMEHQNYRRKNNLHIQLRHNLSKRIQMAIKEASGKKAKSSTTLLGCDIKTARKHLESLWKEGMSWGNYGIPKDDYFKGWHIDHIIPCAKFDLTKEEEQLKCFHYTNLQPLWARENLSKWKNKNVPEY